MCIQIVRLFNVIMSEKLTSFQTAKLAKEKGFKPNGKPSTDYVPGYYEDEENGTYKNGEIQEEDYRIDFRYLAPVQSVLQAYLRDVHDIQIVIIPFAEDSMDENSKAYFHYFINPKMFFAFINRENEIGFNSYEEALEKALYEALNLIK